MPLLLIVYHSAIMFINIIFLVVLILYETLGHGVENWHDLTLGVALGLSIAKLADKILKERD